MAPVCGNPSYHIALRDKDFRLRVAIFPGRQSAYDQSSMRIDKCLRFSVVLLMGTLAFGQTQQPTSAPQSTAQPSANQTSPPTQTNDKCPCKPRTVVDAANASKQKAESQPPTKVYRNKDVKDPSETSATSQETTASSTSASPATPTSAQKQSTAVSDLSSPAAFKAQGDVYKNQILLEKEKIADIQDRITILKYQFDQWSTSFAQDPTDASACWTSSYSTPYYKDWCDQGRVLKAQYDEAQGQLKQEMAHLEKMQEEIRRKGYGNAVYDPDLP
jgi:hypothetical protein